jgi:ABC-type nickel/cobalt efflux system permease component RcnA
MSSVLFTTISITGFTVAFLHAAIPTHWLPFVVAARAQYWNRPKTLVVTGIAGAGHVLFTTALGVFVTWGGMTINSRWSRSFPLIAGGALVAVGLFYLLRQFKGGQGHVHLLGEHSPHHHPHRNHHHRHEHDHNRESHPDASHHHREHADDALEQIEEQWSQRRSDWAVIGGLFTLLTFSPCEAFLPVFLTGARYGWMAFALLSMILAVGTVAGMIVFTWLTLLGLQRLRLKSLDKYEPITLGAVFCLLGVIIILFEH